MARKNNTTLLFVVLGLLVIFGIYCAWDKKYDPEESESYINTRNVRDSNQDIELLQQADHEPVVDSFELLGVADEEPAHQIGFGMGPGVYGSGRHTSEMIGN